MLPGVCIRHLIRVVEELQSNLLFLATRLGYGQGYQLRRGGRTEFKAWPNICPLLFLVYLHTFAFARSPFDSTQSTVLLTRRTHVFLVFFCRWP